METVFTRQVGIEVPLICGAMYPCSNPELVAAVSAAGAIGIVQPISMSYVHGHELRAGLRLIREITDRPIGFNALVEASSRVYMERMKRWVDIAVDEGVRFFITALGNPRWVVEMVHAAGGVVYHDVTERKWADKGLEGGVDGLICVNSRAGGHAGSKGPEQLFDELGGLGLPLIAAGGVGGPEGFSKMLALGYAGVQMGTRFIATKECRAHNDYKAAIVKAKAEDIVHTRRITGIPVSVIRTPYVEAIGTEAGPILRWMLRGKRTKNWARSYLALKSIRSLKKSSLKGGGYRDYYQAGKSVEEIADIEGAGDVVRQFAAVLEESPDAA